MRDYKLGAELEEYCAAIEALCMGERLPGLWEQMLETEHIDRTYAALVWFKQKLAGAQARLKAERENAKVFVYSLPEAQRNKVLAEKERDIGLKREALMRIDREATLRIGQAKTIRHDLHRQPQDTQSRRVLKERIIELEAALRMTLTYVPAAYMDDPNITQVQMVLDGWSASNRSEVKSIVR
jgi:hypothetical protein